MRAKFINEFERGVDPKSVLGLGLYEKIKREYFENYKKHFLPDNPDADDLILWTAINNKPEYLNFLLNTFKYSLRLTPIMLALKNSLFYNNDECSKLILSQYELSTFINFFNNNLMGTGSIKDLKDFIKKHNLEEPINEFERGLDPKTALGIGRVGKIRKWFSDLGISDEWYEITPTEIKCYACLDLFDKDVNWLPDDLIINSHLNLSNTPITELPKGLKVSGYLNLNNTQITQLPDDLEVNGYIYVEPFQMELIDFINKSRFEGKIWIHQ